MQDKFVRLPGDYHDQQAIEPLPMPISVVSVGNKSHVRRANLEDTVTVTRLKLVGSSSL